MLVSTSVDIFSIEYKFIKIAIIIVVIILVGLLMFFLFNDGNSEEEEGVTNNTKEISYNNISPSEFETIVADQDDVFILDVHIPEQDHIAGTDLFIPYNELERNISELPNDKNQKIVVYCRSGSMSKIASEKLIELGYTDVSNLDGGIQAWNSYNQ